MKWRCSTLLQNGISAILARYPMKIRQNACDTPLCDTSGEKKAHKLSTHKLSEKTVNPGTTSG